MTSPIRPLLGLLLLVSVSGCTVARAQNNAQNNTQSTAQNLTSNPSSNPSPAVAPLRESALPQAAPSRLANDRILAQTLAQDVPIGRPEREPATADVTSVEVFKLDNQCEDFEGRVLKLPRDTALNEAVGKAIETSTTLDFSLAGYRVEPGPGFDEATVDFRVVSNSDASSDANAATPEETAQISRTLKSLSMCEGLSLFGSIRRTLTGNGQFGVSRVRFTLAGQELR